MFWRFAGYANVSPIDALLDKPNVTLEEILDESDLMQELKQHTPKLTYYLSRPPTVQKLLDHVIAPKIEAVKNEISESHTNKNEQSNLENQSDVLNGDLYSKKRNRYAYIAAEVLSLDNWAISESLMENQQLLRKFWEFLKTPPPLDPLQASYFTKVNEALFDSRTEDMLIIFKSCEGVVKNMLHHVDSPMIMDLLLKIISLERGKAGQGIVDWLQRQDLMPMLLKFLSSEHTWATQTSAGDFLKAIITISANTPQNQQSCVGPNELTRQLVSQPCVEDLIMYMLKGGNPLTVGVGIVIEVIRKNNSDYDPYVGTEVNSPSNRDPIYLGTLLRLFAQRVPDFMALMLSPNLSSESAQGSITNKRKELNTAFGEKIEPLGFDRFKICELMAELLHCSNMGLLNEAGSEEIIRRRDIERERLKSEGEFGTFMDDSLMKGSRADESKKLHIQNASDDDGFERVSHSGDDNTNDQGNPEPSNITARNDKDFSDESISIKLGDERTFESGLTVLPLSPIKGISRKIDSLGLEANNFGPLSIQETDDPSAYQDNVTQKTHIDEEIVELNQKYPEEITSTDFDTKESGTTNSFDDPAIKNEQLLSSSSSDINESQLDVLLTPLNPHEHPDDIPDPLTLKTVSVGSVPIELTPRHEVCPTEADTIMEESSGENSQFINVGLAVRDYPVVGDFLKIQFVEHKVIPTILDFFFRFPWNNFLHNVVYDVVQQVFNGSMEEGFNRSLAFNLFETGNITIRIINGQKESDKTSQMSKKRLGYMGHLTLIAEEVVKFTERHPPEILSESVLSKIMNNDWITYVEVTLAETRERDNAILGGYRPEKPIGQRPPGSNVGNFGTAFAEAGLNGLGTNDEEDDEMAGAEVGFSILSAPNLDRFDEEEVDYEYLEKLDRETPLFPEGGVQD